MDSPLAGLFLSAFVSSTLLPGGSEALLAYLSHVESAPAPTLLVVATAGNTLGGMTGWMIGRWLAARWPAERLRTEHRRAVEHLRRFGSLALLLSWLPVIGDPLCVAAGWLRIGAVSALVLIAIGKASRYVALMWLVGMSG